MNNRVFCTLLCLLSVLTAYAQEESDQSAGLSVNGGLQLAFPAVQFRNDPSFKSPVPGWQLWVNKEFYQKKPVGIVVSVGASHDLFNVDRKKVGPNGTAISEKMRVQVLYGNVEAGVRVSLLAASRIPLFVMTTFRASTPLHENYSEAHVVGLDSSDLGLNFKLGHKFDLNNVKLYAQLNYYQGLSKLARNKVVSSEGAFDTYIQNRSVGVQIGVSF